MVLLVKYYGKCNYGKSIMENVSELIQITSYLANIYKLYKNNCSQLKSLYKFSQCTANHFQVGFLSSLTIIIRFLKVKNEWVVRKMIFITIVFKED